jgi:hypothetical protein
MQYCVFLRSFRCLLLKRKYPLRRFYVSTVFLVVLTLGYTGTSLAFVWPGSSPWPNSSHNPVEPLQHPTIAERMATLGSSLDNGYRLVIFGDQRALAQGEWQAMVSFIAEHEKSTREETPLLAIVDSGDNVADGRRTDQFQMLAKIMNPLVEYPYLLAVGNHEVHHNSGVEARQNDVTAFANSDPSLAVDRLWRSFDLPFLRMLFLDTNDLIYGPEENEGSVTDHPRVKQQFSWVVDSLASEDMRPIVVVMHHPPISSSKKHKKNAAKLWSMRWRNQTLIEILADGGTDLLLTGHTHTYERFYLQSPLGNVMHSVNISGRPRDSVFWWGSGKRRARDWSEDTMQQLADAGWRDLEGWQIEQRDAMLGDQQNQWAMLHVTPEGRLGIAMFYLLDKGRGYRQEETVWLDGDDSP